MLGISNAFCLLLARTKDQRHLKFLRHICKNSERHDQFTTNLSVTFFILNFTLAVNTYMQCSDVIFRRLKAMAIQVVEFLNEGYKIERFLPKNLN